MKKLGFGLMRLPLLDPNDAAQIDIEQAKQMVDLFMAKGFTYFDTAWMYHAFHSEKAAKEILVSRYPRESFTLATKLHFGFFQSPEERDRVFQAQLDNTGAEYFDYYLVHGISDDSAAHYEKFDCFGWMREKKAAGRMKHIGFSFHGTPELLDRLLTDYPYVEFVQLQLNYLDWNSVGIRARECYEIAVKHQVPVIVMEPVKGGTLANLPEEAEQLFRDTAPGMSPASWAIRFAASQENVMMVLSGMSSISQMEDNLSYMEDFRPLSETEYRVIDQAVEMINRSIAIPCTGCAYCVDGCPMNIPIPKYFSLYNADLQETKNKSWLPQQQYYANLIQDHGKAGDCIGCGQCEGVCPQHLPIVEHMQTVAEHYGS